MRTIDVYWSIDGVLRPGEQPIETLDVADENPYDAGYLLTLEQAEAVLNAWKFHPKEPDVLREYEFSADDTVAATSLVCDGLSITLWESTTDFHDWDTGGNHPDGDPAFSTANWPFDFTVVERPAK